MKDKLKLANSYSLSDVARFNIIYYLKENKLNINFNNIFLNKEYKYKTNLYKYLKGTRTITLNFIESISKILDIDPKNLLDINLYKKNILNNYNFNYKHINHTNAQKNIERNNYIFEKRNLFNRPSLKKLSLELGISKERVRQIAERQKQLKEQNER